MKTKFIVNPISGTGKQKNICKLLQEHYLFNYEIEFTKNQNDAKKIIQEAIKDNFDCIIAVGGDGTLNECLNGIIGSNMSLGVIPCGSGNGFAKHIGMSSNIITSIHQLNEARYKVIDYCTLNSMPFINISGIGFDAHISNLFSNEVNRGFLKYIKLILTQLTYKSNTYKIKINNKNIFVDSFLIAIANASQYGNNFFIAPQSIIDDGMIDIIILKKFPKWKIPLIVFLIFMKKIHKSKYVISYKAKKIEIDSINNLVHLDGEPKFTNKKIDINIHQKSIKFLIPNEKK